MLVDSHCHLDMLISDDVDLSSVIDRAKQQQVMHMLTVNVNIAEFPKILAIAEKYPEIDCSVGMHPTDAQGENIVAEEIVKLATHNKVVAIGETGLDYYRLTAADEQIRQQQQTNFREQIKAACRIKKPLIIHTRMAVDDTLTIMREENAK